jgi:hypothetical protein
VALADFTLVSAARTTLFESLKATFKATPWRVHRVTPSTIVSPTVYIDSVEMGWTFESNARFVRATFPIVAVADGTDQRQVEQLDDMLALVWDSAILAGGEPDSSVPQAIDVGGPNLRAQVLRASMTITASTLCPAALALTGGN